MFNVNFVANFFLVQILLPLMLDGNTRCEEFMGVSNKKLERYWSKSEQIQRNYIFLKWNRFELTKLGPIFNK